MSQSLAAIYIHLTFAPKYRRPCLTDTIRPDLHRYMTGVIKSTGSKVLIINSVEDHIHLLFRLEKTKSLSYIIEHAKKRTSSWIKTLNGSPNNFAWQSGYGAFSVSASGIESVKKYIANQKHHHEKMTYEEELEILFRKYGVEKYDPELYWS